MMFVHKKLVAKVKFCVQKNYFFSFNDFSCLQISSFHNYSLMPSILYVLGRLDNYLLRIIFSLPLFESRHHGNTNFQSLIHLFNDD